MNQKTLSKDTEIVLLLCGRFGGESQEPFQPLSAREYGECAKWLNAHGLRPADLLLDVGQEHLPKLHEAKLERKRVDFLLGRGTALALALERWSRGGLWVISRGDAQFPKRLKRHLKHAAPPLLYGAGDQLRLDAGGLAITGSRDASDAALDFTRTIAARCAREGLSVVSGGARGVDAAAMQGVTEAGGVSIGVLANDLLKMSVNRHNRVGLQEGRLVLISPFYPEAGFNAGNAMARNKYIYTLADQALVIESAVGKGGTWEGALETLRHKWVPLYVRMPGDGPGNAALVAQGGLEFRLAANCNEALSDFFARTAPVIADAAINDAPLQQSLLAAGNADAPRVATSTATLVEVKQVLPDESLRLTPAPAAASEPDTDALPQLESRAPVAVAISPTQARDMYNDFSTKLAQALADGPLNEDQIATLLCIEKGQAKTWLKRAASNGDVEKLKKPVRYALRLQPALC